MESYKYKIFDRKVLIEKTQKVGAPSISARKENAGMPAYSYRRIFRRMN